MYKHRENYQQPAEYWHAGFAEHQILRQGERCLLLRNPANPNNWMTISIDDGGQLAVWGDNTPVIFAYNEAETLAGRIAWMGCHEYVDSYVSEKATIGTGSGRLTKTYAESFEADVREYLLAEIESNPEMPEATRSQMTWDAFHDGCSYQAMEALEHSPVAALWEFDAYLRDIDWPGEAEDWGTLGSRSTGDVERAHAAIRRAWVLLTERGAYKAPPEER